MLAQAGREVELGGPDAAEDELKVAVAAFPTDSGYAAAQLVTPQFTNSIPSLKDAVDRIALPPSDDETGARFCDAMNEGLKFFPVEVKDACLGHQDGSIGGRYDHYRFDDEKREAFLAWESHLLALMQEKLDAKVVALPKRPRTRTRRSNSAVNG